MHLKDVIMHFLIVSKLRSINFNTFVEYKYSQRVKSFSYAHIFGLITILKIENMHKNAPGVFLSSLFQNLQVTD